jgi:hypothetical protein
MSKISEQKALEAYPIKIRHSLDANRQCREGYIKGYEQSMQDFLEKACYYLKSTLQEDDETNDFIIEQFKKYMQNE